MNEMLNSSSWPNVPTSRLNMNEYFNFTSMSAWQPVTTPSELYSSGDYNNVWSAKTEVIEENDNKDSIWKSIWSTDTSQSVCSTDTNSLASDGPKHVEETPTNSPTLKRTELINCNERWGCVKINQLTPWSVVEIKESERQVHDPMVWRAKVDGTEVWEDYYVKQHGRRQPQSDSSFSSDNVWSAASEVSQSTNSLWPLKNSEISSPSSDIYNQNIFTDVSNRSTFGPQNGVRPSMTRNQAQKYLIDMGYSLSDAIGALVNNQMDLPKAISELQTKYRGGRLFSSASLPYGTGSGGGSKGTAAAENLNYGRLQGPPPSLGHLLGAGCNGGSYSVFQEQQEALHQCTETSLGYPPECAPRTSAPLSSQDPKRALPYRYGGPSMYAPQEPLQASLGRMCSLGATPNGLYAPHYGQKWQPQTQPHSQQGHFQRQSCKQPVGVLIRKVPQHQMEAVRSICLETGPLAGLQAHPQGVVAAFLAGGDARRCAAALQGRLGLRAEVVGLGQDEGGLQMPPLM